MAKSRFIWRRKHQVFVFKGCGGSSVDIALWFQSTASSLNLWKLIISFQQYFASELYSSFEIILLSKITSLGALHMLLCLTRCPLTKHQACCEMLVRAHLKRPIASVWHFFCCKFSSPYRSNFTRHPTLFLFCKEQLPVLGSSVCFVAAFGLVSAEQQSTVVNANTVNIVNIVNIQGWGKTIPSLLLTYTTCWWWFSDIITCSSNFFAKGEGRLLHFSTFPHFLFP